MKKIERLLHNKNETVIFGAGRYGKALFIILQELDITVHYFIDNDLRKNGVEIIGGVKCRIPCEVSKNVRCAIAVNDIYSDDIYQQAVNLGFSDIILFFNSDLQELMKSFDDETCIRILFKGIYKKELNLNHPITFNEKLNWLKLNDRRSDLTIMVDKYAVRKYVASKIGNDYLVPLLDEPRKNFDEINISSLPNQFVLKCTHDSGSVFVCKDKQNFDFESIRKKVVLKLNANFFYMFREWAYKDVPPRIIIEKYLQDTSGDDIIDYKFFCFNGEPKIVAVEFRRYNTPFFKSPVCNYYSIDDWKYLGFTTTYPTDEDIKIDPPICLSEMLKIVRILSCTLAFARIDLYCISGKVYFSEITLAHMGGFSCFSPEKWDIKLGNLIDLSGY